MTAVTFVNYEEKIIPMMESEERYSLSAKRSKHIIIEFKGNRRKQFYNPFEFPFKLGDTAIVEADRGEDAGIVRHILNSALPQHDYPMFKVVRRASTEDFRRIEYHRELEPSAYEICQKKIIEHRLPMRLVDSEYRFDGLKLMFFYTADARVDFRELVRDLAGTFRTRIELRQIGTRDELKRWDTYGVCGLKLCCTTFLNTFHTITTQIARSQNLILNPAKLSGMCGRLKCCLRFEYEDYLSSGGSHPFTQMDDPEESADGVDKISD
ncbi:MAG: regulatory iron-sulfur-containing complex subunit RicT [Candidatus Electryoneaceae bacterium]|nr:regulatory iron-sulfur-containing complex subunit RicT [Candidatus Electryoneaceae bacterium]